MFKHHDKIEKNSFILLILTIVVVAIGGLIEIVPLFRLETTIEKVSGVRPLTPLELAGQNIYIREGCYNCHSQQIRPLRDEVERYGHYSLAAESMYDHPFQWGSKRTGPELARVGGKYSDEWHKDHLINPQSVVPASIMPRYGFLMDRAAKVDDLGEHLNTLQIVGVPYTDAMIANATADAKAQATPEIDATALITRYGTKATQRDFDGNPQFVSEMDALISYLQVLGTLADLKDYDLQNPVTPMTSDAATTVPETMDSSRESVSTEKEEEK
jgi:cytochrome c oxidase cbb3-type subunit 2